jgi:endonuclease/exonuclease/phosphatase (EEP) superfamily protein YafD
MSVALHLFSLIVTIGSFLPLWRCESWIIRVWDFPRLQLLIAALLCLILQFVIGIEEFFPDGLISLLLASSIAYLAIRIWPYQALARKEVLDGQGKVGIRLLISNVLMSNRESHKLVELVRVQNPDLLIALETDRWWVEELLSLEDLLLHTIAVPQPDTYGLILMSKIPFTDTEVKHLVRGNIPSVHGKIQLPIGAPIRFHALHPKPPFPDEDTTSTDRDIELMLVAEEVRKTGGASIVFGDMNDVAWSHTTRLFRRVSGMLDLRIGRGLFSTFHAGHWWMRWPLDHVFVSDEFRVREIVRLPSIGSDHFPILVDLSYEPELEHEQDEPQHSEQDAEERDELLNKPSPF